MARLLKWCARVGLITQLLGLMAYLAFTAKASSSSDAKSRWFFGIILLPTLAFGIGCLALIALFLKKQRPERWSHAITNVAGFLLLAAGLWFGWRTEISYWSRTGSSIANLDGHGRIIFGTGMNEPQLDEERLVGISLTQSWYSWRLRFLEGYSDETGKIVIPPQFVSARPFRGGFAVVEKDRRFGVIDQNARWIIPPEYEELWFLSEGMYNACLGGQWGYIDTNNTVKIPFQFEHARPFYEGLAAVRQGGKWGFIDSTGEMKIEPSFDQVKAFSEGLAPFNIGGRIVATPGFESVEVGFGGGKWGYINRDGKEVIEPQFDFAGSFMNGSAEVKLGGSTRRINSSGKFIQIVE